MIAMRFARPLTLLLPLVLLALLTPRTDVYGQAPGTPTQLEVGSTIPTFITTDQHGTSFTWQPGPKYLLISFDMSTGKKANQSLSELGADFLPEQNALYMANIYGMPKIGRFFAFRKMKKYPHRILYADQQGLLDPFPQTKDQVTLFTLDSKGAITEISYWDPEKTNLKDLLVKP